MKDTIQFKLLNEKIIVLQTKVDSLINSDKLHKLQFDINQKQDLISQVNSFYDSAWIKLLFVITVLGILVPLIAQYFQRKSLKDLTTFIQNQLRESFDAKIDQLKAFNTSEMEMNMKTVTDNIKSIENKNQNLFYELDATTYYLQGRTYLLNKEFVGGARSFIISAFLWLKTERPEKSLIQLVNLKICLKSISDKNILENIKTDVTGIEYKNVDEMVEHFKNHDRKELIEKALDLVLVEIERIKNGV